MDRLVFLLGHLLLFDYRVDVSVTVYSSDFQYRGKKLWISTLALFLSLWLDFNLQPWGKFVTVRLNLSGGLGMRLITHTTMLTDMNLDSWILRFDNICRFHYSDLYPSQEVQGYTISCSFFDWEHPNL